MRKIVYIVALLFVGFLLIGCQNPNDSSKDDNPTNVESTNPTDSEPKKEPFSILTEVLEGYSVKDSVYTFYKSGEYTVSGDLDGSLLFADTIDGSVILYLNNVNIKAEVSPAIYWAKDSKKIEIKGVEGTTNKIVQVMNADYTNSAIESENNIEIGGKGKIIIEGMQKHAVKGSDITIKGSIDLDISSLKDGIHGKTILVKGGNTVIHNVEDAFQAEYTKSNTKGNITVENGVITISDCITGFKADNLLTIKPVDLSSEDIVIVLTNVTQALSSLLYDLDVSKITQDGSPYKE